MTDLKLFLCGFSTHVGVRRELVKWNGCRWETLGNIGEMAGSVEQCWENVGGWLEILFIYLSFFGQQQGVLRKRLDYAKRTFSNLTQLSKFYEQFPNSCNIVTLPISQKDQKNWQHWKKNKKLITKSNISSYLEREVFELWTAF